MQTTWCDEEREGMNDSGGISFPKTSTNPNPSPKGLVSLLPTLTNRHTLSPPNYFSNFLIFHLFCACSVSLVVPAIEFVCTQSRHHIRGWRLFGRFASPFFYLIF